MNPITIDAWKYWSVKKLKIFQFQSVERNRARNRKTLKNIFDWSRGIEATWEFHIKTGILFFLFNQSKDRLDWSNPEESEIFYKTFGKQIFMIWDAC